MNNNIYKSVSDRLGFDEKTVKDVFDYTFKFIREHISSLELKNTNYTEEEFNELKTSFNLPSLGKLGCTYKDYISHNKNFKRKRDDKDD